MPVPTPTRLVIRTLLAATSRTRVVRQCASRRAAYLQLADKLSGNQGEQPVRVPAMQGVDPDMREWSFFQLLEHNCIVNRSITATIRELTLGVPLPDYVVRDPKRDVMPQETAGSEWVDAFLTSIDAHTQTLREVGRLRGTETRPHSRFGLFDAHRWNAMFTFHLKLHLRQAEYIVAHVSDSA